MQPYLRHVLSSGAPTRPCKMIIAPEAANLSAIDLSPQQQCGTDNRLRMTQMTADEEKTRFATETANLPTDLSAEQPCDTDDRLRMIQMSADEEKTRFATETANLPINSRPEQQCVTDKRSCMKRNADEETNTAKQTIDSNGHSNLIMIGTSTCSRGGLVCTEPSVTLSNVKMKITWDDETRLHLHNAILLSLKSSTERRKPRLDWDAVAVFLRDDLVTIEKTQKGEVRKSKPSCQTVWSRMLKKFKEAKGSQALESNGTDRGLELFHEYESLLQAAKSGPVTKASDAKSGPVAESSGAKSGPLGEFSDAAQVRMSIEKSKMTLDNEFERLNAWIQNEVIPNARTGSKDILIAGERRKRMKSDTVASGGGYFDTFCRKQLEGKIDIDIRASFEHLRNKFAKDIAQMSEDVANKILDETV